MHADLVALPSLNASIQHLRETHQQPWLNSLPNRLQTTLPVHLDRHICSQNHLPSLPNLSSGFNFSPHISEESWHPSSSLKMGIIGFECTMSHMTVERAMKICLHADQVLPELLPQFFGSVERLEGVGDVGSTRVVTLGPGVPGAAGMKVTKRVTVNDIAISTYCYGNVDDPRFNTFIYTFKFTTGPDGSGTIINWQVEFEPRDPATPPPEEVKFVGHEIMKSMEKYTLEHPAWP